MKRWIGKIAVITGTSSGIGEGLAREFVQKGLQVVGLARRVEIVEKISKQLGNCPGVLYPIQADVTKKDDIEKAFCKIKERFGEIHILINNAGIARFGSMADGNVDDWRKVLHTNVLGLSIVTKEALKLMNDVDPLTPHIVNINSLAGQRIFVGTISDIPNAMILFYGDPYGLAAPNPNVTKPELPIRARFENKNCISSVRDRTSMYGASKHAFTSLTNALRHDLKLASRKIRVTSINPGLVDTNIIDKDIMAKFPNMKVDHIVEVIVFALNTPSTVEVQQITVDHPDMLYSPEHVL